MTRTILLWIAAAAVLVDGVVYGLWTDRWGNSRTVEEAVAALERVPLTIGDWQGESKDLGVRQAEQAGFAGYWLRRYERRTDGMVVHVMLACGRPGPLCVHTPTVCYAGAGFEQSEAPAKYVAAAETNTPPEFWKAKFSMADAAVPVHLRIYYSWRTPDAWKASDSPRLQFARESVLFKMYVTQTMTGRDERKEESACVEFMNLFLPELEKTCFKP
jgi:hypothetical protein